MLFSYVFDNSRLSGIYQGEFPMDSEALKSGSSTTHSLCKTTLSVCTDTVSTAIVSGQDGVREGEAHMVPSTNKDNA